MNTRASGTFGKTARYDNDRPQVTLSVISGVGVQQTRKRMQQMLKWVRQRERVSDGPCLQLQTNAGGCRMATDAQNRLVRRIDNTKNRLRVQADDRSESIGGAQIVPQFGRASHSKRSPVDQARNQLDSGRSSTTKPGQNECITRRN